MHLSNFLRSTVSIRTFFLAAVTQAQAPGSCSSRSSSSSSSAPDGEACPDMGDENYKSAASVYDFTARDIDGNDVSMAKYKGKVLIIVNVACKCGFTNNHYKELVELHHKYRAAGLDILGFPCNQFAGQEPNSESEIKSFVKDFNVEFDMFSKVEVNGSGAHPLWKYLKHKQGGTLVDAIKWNFTKFVVDRNGQPVGRYSPQTSPKELESEIEKLIKQG